MTDKILSLKEVAAAKARADAATKGPWCWRGYNLMQDCLDADGLPETNPYFTPAGEPIAYDGSASGEYLEKIDTNGGDAKFIAAARTDVPALCTTIEVLADALRGLIADSESADQSVEWSRLARARRKAATALLAQLEEK